MSDAPLSTFSIDVDTASYANVRRFLNEGTLPPADAVRVEELINYFHFDYPDSTDRAPFGVTAEVAPCPWNAKHTLALIGLQAKRMAAGKTPPRNLVFLLDVSGSMTPANKLPLVRTAMKMLAETLTAKDRVAIVVYAGASGLVLPATPGDAGNGNYSYLDSLHEARRVLIAEAGSTLVAVANDVKIQVEFNPGLTRSPRRSRDRDAPANLTFAAALRAAKGRTSGADTSSRLILSCLYPTHSPDLQRPAAAFTAVPFRESRARPLLVCDLRVRFVSGLCSSARSA